MRKEEKMSMQRIGNKYYARFSFVGKQYRFSLKTSNIKVANQISSQLERGLDRGLFDDFEDGTDGHNMLQLMVARPGLSAEEARNQISTKSHSKNLREAVDEYLENCKSEHSPKTYVNEDRTFEHFLASISAVHVHQVRPEMIESWRNKRMEKVQKPTVNRELKMVKTFFNQAVKKSYVLKSPAESVKTYRETDKAIHHLSDDQIKKVLENAPEDLRQVIIFFLLTGLRYGELCYLTWADIDFRRKQIIIQPKKGWSPKNLKKRVVPMHVKVEAILRQLPRGRSEFVFANNDGNCPEQSLRSRIYQVFEDAKVKGNVKDFRSTFASNAVMSGLPIYTVSKLLGHSDVKITEKHYAHLAPDYMGNAMASLNPQWQVGSKIKNAASKRLSAPKQDRVIENMRKNAQTNKE